MTGSSEQAVPRDAGAAPPRKHPLLRLLDSADLRRMLPGIVLTSFLANLSAFALPLTILAILDRVLTNQSVETLVVLTVGVLLAIVVEEALRGVGGRLTGWLAARMEHTESVAAFERLLQIPLPELRKVEPGVQAERVSAASRVAEFYAGQTLLVILDVPFVLLFLAAIYAVGGWVVIVPIGLLAMFLGIAQVYGKRLRARILEQRTLDDRRLGFLTEVFSGLHSVRTLSMEPQMERRHERLLEGAARVNEELARDNALAGSIALLFSQSTTVLMVVAGSWAVLSNEMTPGSLAACMMLAMRALQPVRRAFTAWLRYQAFLASDARLAEIKGMEGADTAGGADLGAALSGIELRGVSVGAPGREPLIAGVDLAVRVGECLALQGDSGSGKSSLLSVMNGLEAPLAGTVLVDGRPLQEYSADSLRRGVALLQQGGAIFAGTVLENLTMFDAAVNDAALRVSREIGLDAVVSQMRLGYQTPLGEGGVDTLPAGVRQMIAICRALAQDPRVILFDEANSYLDMDGDAAVKAALLRRKPECAIVLVTHRPSTLALADRVLRIEGGRLRAPDGEVRADPLAVPVVVAPEARPAPAEDLDALVRGHFEKQSDLSRCLLPALRALKWRGSGRQLAEAMPQMLWQLDLTGFRAVLANLGYSMRRVTRSAEATDGRLLPCLVLPAGRPALVVSARLPDGRLQVFDSAAGAESDVEPAQAAGEAFVLRPREERAQAGGYFGRLLRRFRRNIALALALTGCGAILALGPALFVKMTYDRILPTGDIPTQTMLFAGVTLVIALDFVLRLLRGEILAHVAGRADYFVGSAIFSRVLRLPASMTESVPVNRQVGRLRAFDGLRDFFLGPLVVIAIDLPASVVLVVALGILNPLALLVVLAGAAVFGLLARLARLRVEHTAGTTSRILARRREFLDESIALNAAVRASGRTRAWIDRFRDLTAKAVLAGFRDQQGQAAVTGAAQVTGTATGVLAMALSAFEAVTGNLSGGTMMATMMIVWRITGPMQNLFLASTSLVRIRASAAQVENLMRLSPEADSRADFGEQATPGAATAVAFNRVSFRYASDADPALLGVSFEIRPRELVVVTGPNGSGKSTLLKLMSRAYSPQAGTVKFNRLDIRQVPARDLRERISYMPQHGALFYGTVAQNLRLAHPTATDEELAWSCRMAGLEDDLRALRDGLDERISENRASRLPAGFRQRLSLARALLRPAGLVILDEPGSGLDRQGDEALQRCVEWLRVRATVVMVSHRPAHMRMADRVIYMTNGSIAAMGKFDVIRNALMSGVPR